MKPLSIVLLISLVITVLLVGCNMDGPTTDETSDSQSTTEISIETALKIVSDGRANYKIIRNETADSATIEASEIVRRLIENTTGVTIDIATDWVKRGSTLDHSAPEILIGQTAYEESQQALDGVPYGNYIVTTVGSKLVINAWSVDGLNEAVTAFGNELISNEKKGNVSLSSDIHLSGTSNETANHIPVYPDGYVQTVYNSGDQNYVLIVSQTDSEAYSTYLDTLGSEGYTLYHQHEIANNQFATFVHQDYVINAGFYPHEKTTRIVIEPRTTLVPLEADNIYTDRGVESSFAMLGVSPDNLDTAAGMSFVFQLVDGSYIVFDGGNDRDRDASLLYHYLRDHAPDPNQITIAAWVITHSHGDHYGAYIAFTEAYADKVKVEYLIGNFPSDQARVDGGLGKEGAGGSEILSLLKKYDGAKFIKAHTGQEYFLRNARLEILYTLENYAPGVLSYFNTSSLICRVEIAGQVFNITADASNDACTIAHKMYGDYLKADFVQMCHHGHSTGSTVYKGVTTFYTLSAAPIVIWPTSDDSITDMLSKRAYDAHLYNLPTTKEIFVAGTREVRLVLPYTAGSSGLSSILK